MQKKTFDELIDIVRKDLKDESSKPVWTDSDIVLALNEAQCMFCEDTHILRQQCVITQKENQEVYSFPDNIIKAIRMENEDGNEIKGTTSEHLQETKGEKYRTVTGTPKEYYSDLDGIDKFRFYPKPSPSLEDAGQEVTYYHYNLIDIDSPNVQTVAFTVYNQQLWVMDERAIWVYDEIYRLINRYDHGLTIALTDKKTIAVAQSTTNATVLNGTVFFSHEDKVYTFHPSTYTGSGSVTLFGTASADIDEMFILNHITGTPLYMNETGAVDTALTPTSSFSESFTTEKFFEAHTIPFITDTKHLVTNGSKIFTILTSTSAVSDSSSVTNSGGIVKDDKGVIYYNAGQVLNTYVHGDDAIGTITPVSPSVTLSAQATIHTDGTAIYVSQSTTTGQARIVDGVVKSTLQDGDSNNFIPAGGKRFIDEVVYTSTKGLLSTNNDLGEIVYSDGSRFTQDEGIIIDVTDTDENIFFTGDESGAVTGINNETDQATLMYSRYPLEDTLEVSDWRAVVNYAKFILLNILGSRENIARAQLFLSNYRTSVNKQSRLNSQVRITGTIPVSF
jgi:hypothetical protein